MKVWHLHSLRRPLNEHRGSNHMLCSMGVTECS